MGVGDEISSLAAGAEPGAPTLTVFVAEPVSTEMVRSILVDSLGVAAAGEQVPIEVVITGVIEAQPHQFRQRPAPGGISVGHFRITAGTLGCLSKGARRPATPDPGAEQQPRPGRRQRRRSRATASRSQVRADGGSCPNDQIAVLERFVPISFSSPQLRRLRDGMVLARPGTARARLPQRGTPTYFRIGSSVMAPTVGLPVGKSGRTTQLTKGRITAVGATVNVNMGAGRVAQFRDQIAIHGDSGVFSQGGDSGSVIWNWANGRPAGGAAVRRRRKDDFRQPDGSCPRRAGHRPLHLTRGRPVQGRGTITGMPETFDEPSAVPFEDAAVPYDPGEESIPESALAAVIKRARTGAARHRGRGGRRRRPGRHRPRRGRRLHP